MKQDHPKLIFVYNANSGMGNAMIDAAHKILNPATYSCSLCQLTYGAIREKASWKRFREEATIPMQFLHKDEFARDWGAERLKQFEFPALFKHADGVLKQVIPATELNAMASVQELMQRVRLVMEADQKA